jgi:hypothetical protein
LRVDDLAEGLLVEFNRRGLRLTERSGRDNSPCEKSPPTFEQRHLFSSPISANAPPTGKSDLPDTTCVVSPL